MVASNFAALRHPPCIIRPLFNPKASHVQIVRHECSADLPESPCSSRSCRRAPPHRMPGPSSRTRQGNGRGQPQVGHVLGVGVGRQLRAEQTIAGPLAVTTVTNYTRAINLTVPASRATGTTMPPAIPGAPPPQPGLQSEHHGHQHRLDAAAGDLGHPVGFPERRRGQHRDLSLSTDRRPDGHRRVVVAGSEGASGGRRTGSTATSTIRTWSSASKPGWSTPSSGTSMSTPRPATARISAG